MNRLTDKKIVLVTRPTRLAELVIRFNTVSQARFYVEHLGADFSDYLREDETYHHALVEAQKLLAQVSHGSRDFSRFKNPVPASGKLPFSVASVASVFKSPSPCHARVNPDVG